MRSIQEGEMVRERVRETVRWGSSVLVESAFRQAELLVVGDPRVAASGPPVEAEELGAAAVGFVERPAGRMLALRNPDPDEAALVAASGAGDDPVRLLTVSFGSLGTGAHEGEVVGSVDSASGRLVVGTPEAVAAWGTEARPVEGLAAQARAYRYGKVPALLGLIVVARVVAGAQTVRVWADGDHLAEVTVTRAGRPVQHRLPLVPLAG